MSPLVDGRRDLLRQLAGLGLALGAGGCGEPARPGVPLSNVPDGGRFETLHEGLPVELRRDGDRVEARSLLCTHMGCRVRWREAEGDYLCPCHQGRFDAEGRPVDGPAQRPLSGVPVRVSGDAILLGA